MNDHTSVHQRDVPNHSFSCRIWINIWKRIEIQHWIQGRTLSVPFAREFSKRNPACSHIGVNLENRTDHRLLVDLRSQIRQVLMIRFQHLKHWMHFRLVTPLLVLLDQLPMAMVPAMYPIEELQVVVPIRVLPLVTILPMVTLMVPSNDTMGINQRMTIHLQGHTIPLLTMNSPLRVSVQRHFLYVSNVTFYMYQTSEFWILIVICSSPLVHLWKLIDWLFSHIFTTD